MRAYDDLWSIIKGTSEMGTIDNIIRLQGTM
jgi:hypothetical protein